MPSITYASELDQLRQQLTTCLSLVDDQAEQIRQLTTENTEFRTYIAELEESTQDESRTNERGTNQTSLTTARGNETEDQGARGTNCTSANGTENTQGAGCTTENTTQSASKERENTEEKTQNVTTLKQQLAQRNQQIDNLLEELNRCYSRINTYENEKRYEDRLFKVEAAHLSPADKLIIREVRHLNRRTKDDPYAHNRVCLSVLAQNVGASESTIGRRVKMLAQANFIETVTTPPTKDDDRSHLDIALLPILDDPDDIKREQEREHGGIRLCEKCGSERKNRYSVHVCKECQDVTIHDLPGNTIPLAFQNAFSIMITAETQDKEIDVISNTDNTFNDEVTTCIHETNTSTSLDVINALVAIMKNYHVMHMPGMTCTCGCQLWRNVLGEFACCKCEPSNLWPDAYNNMIKVLYPDRQRR